MKKLPLFVALIPWILVVGCSPTQSQVDYTSALNQAGIVAAQGAPFYLSSDGKTMQWDRELDFGTSVKLTGEAQPLEVTIAGKTVVVLPVELSEVGGVAGWIPAALFAGEGAEPAAVIAPTAVREGAGDTSSILRSLERGALVAVVRDSSSGDFFPVKLASVVGAVQYTTAFVKAADLTLDATAVKAAVALARAQAIRGEDERKALLDEIRIAFGNSEFGPDIARASGEGEETAEGPELENLQATLTVGQDDTKVRSAPDSQAEVVETLALDAEVVITARTIRAETIDGQEGRWYQLDGDEPRWIFGASLVGAD